MYVGVAQGRTRVEPARGACLDGGGGAIPRRMEALTQLGPDLWAATRPLPLIVGDIGTRMIVVRLPDGSLLLHSPVRLDEATRRALDALGPVQHVVAPSLVHHLFAGDYAAGYPSARVFAAPGLPDKRRDLRVDEILGDGAPAAWGGALELHLFRGAPRINEVVFFHPASRTLILTDLAFNVVSPPSGRARLFLGLVGAAGRFGPHRLLRLLIRDRRAARASLDRILAWDFDRVTVTHGDVLERGGKERLAEAFAFLR